MQAVRSGVRSLVWRPANHTIKNLPKYFTIAESKDLEQRNGHGAVFFRGFFGRRDYTQVVYSPATYLDKQEVTDRVLQVFKSYPSVDPSKVGPSCHFEKDLKLDILDIVEIMMGMEEEFAIDIPNGETDKMASCADVIKYVTTNPQAK